MDSGRKPRYFNVRDPFPDDIVINVNEDSAIFEAQYQRKDKIGSGGFGLVYNGYDIRNKKKVVLKYIKEKAVPIYGIIEGQVYPMEVILLLKAKRIKGVIDILGLHRFNSFWIIVMPKENEETIDLYDYIGDKVNLTESYAAFILHQLVGILLNCHHLGILHRDIKDENILINKKTLTIKLIDFGSGTLLKKSRYDDFDGTRVYCPPEWILEKKYDGLKAEIWTIGVLLYDMVCGDVPFTNDEQILSGNFVYKRRTPSPELDCLIRSCLNKDPRLRPSLGMILMSKWMRNLVPIKYQNDVSIEYGFVNLFKDNLHFTCQHNDEINGIQFETYVPRYNFNTKPFIFNDVLQVKSTNEIAAVKLYLINYETEKCMVERQNSNYKQINKILYSKPYDFYSYFPRSSSCKNINASSQESITDDEPYRTRARKLNPIQDIQKPFCDMNFVKEKIC